MRVIPAGVVFGAGGWSVRILIRVRICRNVDMCLASCFVMPFKTKNSLVWPEYRYKTWTVGSNPVRYHAPISCRRNVEAARFKQPPNRWQVAGMKTPCFGSAWNRQDAAPPPNQSGMMFPKEKFFPVKRLQFTAKCNESRVCRRVGIRHARMQKARIRSSRVSF